jgi:SAM-dependent methyltransferase
LTNDFRTLGSHSAEYFGDTRDHWWNDDFLHLMAKRLSLHDVRDVLDVGCGVGHWGQLLANVLPSAAQLQGIDRDPHWVEQANARAKVKGLADRFSYQVAVAEHLPFADACFDLVTCQTVLIHAADPGAIIDQMIRVARPGGLILAAEPNNISRALVFDSLRFHDPVDEIVACVRFQLVCERGKAALGEGHNSIGDLVPGLFADRGLVNISVHLNDKTDVLIPPYDTPAQRAMLEEGVDTSGRDFWIWSRADTKRYFLAGGGLDSDFEELWSIAIGGRDQFDKGIAARTYSSAGASIGYLVAGNRPGRR